MSDTLQLYTENERGSSEQECARTAKARTRVETLGDRLGVAQHALAEHARQMLRQLAQRDRYLQHHNGSQGQFTRYRYSHVSARLFSLYKCRACACSAGDIAADIPTVRVSATAIFCPNDVAL